MKALKFIVGLGLVALWLPFATHNPTYLNLAILVLMGAQLGVAWNLLGGYAGQVASNVSTNSPSASQ